jgi:IrrE N-terminal-like domain
MKPPPARIATPESAADITREVKKLLRAADVRHRLPTPREEILACARLVESGELDLAEYESTLREKALRLFHRATSKVLGLLDRSSEIIYVDPSIHASRRIFVTYHEVTHKILPWQKIAVTEDDSATLSADCENIFEAEANYGAADILFQCERFEEEARDHDLSIGSALYLATNYDASCHAALRRFAERNHRPCLLMVLKPTSRHHEDGTSYYVVYFLPSRSFTNDFGEPFNQTFLRPDSDLGAIVNGGSAGEMVLADTKGFPKTCTAEVFSNSFNTFLLIYPQHDRLARKTVRLKLNGTVVSSL